jgi:hypothetical protein
MAWKGRQPVQPDFDRLSALLVNSKVQSENNSLYLVIQGLIQSLQQYQEITNDRIKELEDTP